MKAEIVSVGTELLLGQIVDTNAAYLSNRLAEHGIDIYYRVTVGDNEQRLKEALVQALDRADVVFTIGGLGPTQDDITKETAADVVGDEMMLDEESAEHLKRFFKARGVEMPKTNIKQAMKPKRGILLYNAFGTAPGAVFETSDKKAIITLPGPPREFKPMLDNYALPYLIKKIGSKTSIIKSRVLHVSGLGESTVENMVKEYLSSENPTVAPYVGKGDVMLRITSKSSTEEEAEALINEMDAKLSLILNDNIYGRDDTTIEKVLVKQLITSGLTISVAESCTGGLISSRITDIPGSSAVMLMGIISYSNKSKIKLLDVDKHLIDTHGAVSEIIAREMAEGIRNLAKSDIGIGVTGIAGPDGGSIEKPVGLVYIAVSSALGAEVQRHRFLGNREDIKMRTAQAALDMVRSTIKRL